MSDKADRIEELLDSLGQYGKLGELAPLTKYLIDSEVTDEEFDYFSTAGFNPMEECPLCEETWLECYRSDECRLTDAHYSVKLDAMVCFYCYESDSSAPQGTVIIFDPKAKDVTKWTVYSLEDWKQTANLEWCDEIPDLNEIGWDYTETDELCPIQLSYIRSSAWRGRYEAKADGWVTLHDDGILAYSNNEQKLKTFSDLVLRLLWTANVEYALIIGTTSNLFYQTYEIKTRGEIPEEIKGIMKALKTAYRDPEEYSLTALTGKSDDYTETDRKFAAYAKRIMNGGSLAEIIDEIQELTK